MKSLGCFLHNPISKVLEKDWVFREKLFVVGLGERR